MRDVSKMVLAVVGALVLFVVLVYGSIYFSTQVSMDTADRRGEADKMEQVEADGSYRIAKYDRFHNLCQDIQAKNEQIKLAEDSLSGTRETEVVLAHESTKAEMVGDYNSMAAQDYTAGQFRDSDLPYRIDVNDRSIECG